MIHQDFNDMPPITSTDTVESFLSSAGVHYKLTSHAKLDGSAANASFVSGTSPAHGVKSLLLKLDERDFVLVAVRGADKADYKKIKSLLRTKNIRLASQEEVLTITGFMPGTVPPFGSMFRLRTLVDRLVIKNALVACGAGSLTHTIELKSADLTQLKETVVVDIAKASS